MSLVSILNRAKDYFLEPDNEVASGWLLMDNLKLVLFINFLYWSFVRKIGPQWMSNRKPFDLKLPMKVYNLFQVIACTAMVLWPFTNAKLAYSMFTFGCGDCLPTDSVEYYQLRRYSWCYFILKLVDFLDTIFMVIRKKDKQVSFLHVFHHISIPILTMVFVRYSFSEHVTIHIFLNSLVHVFMYGYYFLASLGPEMQKRLWWKRYITVLQLAQFGIFACVTIYALFANCKVTRLGLVAGLGFPMYFIYLFGNFYIMAYLGKKKVK